MNGLAVIPLAENGDTIRVTQLRSVSSWIRAETFHSRISWWFCPVSPSCSINQPLSGTKLVCTDQQPHTPHV
ncbi:hypothetical protein CGRA01v4_11759 [Colletotrichum graminicola]|nr:hypothetical protein CGRA01v4_11759 [Colletotrichum graminicola]